MNCTIALLEEVAEYLEPEMDADGTPDGYRPNRAMQLYTAVGQEIERLKRKSIQFDIGDGL